MEWFGHNLVGSIRCSVSPQCGDHELGRARTGLRPFRVSPRLGQATDLAVTQAVVGEDEKFEKQQESPNAMLTVDVIRSAPDTR
jgi:hypothetical protein